MVEETKLQSIAVRFASYVEELREFFKSRGVRFGSPEDLVPFAERVAEPGAFQDEMGSMVRSILFRENETLGRGELLELVAVSVGGTAVETAAQEMHSSVRQVFVFVNEALRQRRRMVPKEAEAVVDPTVTAGDILAATAAAKEALEGQAVAGRSPENGFQAEQPADGEKRADAEGIAVRDRSAGNQVLFRAVSMAEAESDHERQVPRLSLTGSERPRWMVPVIVAGVAFLGLGGYLLERGVATHPGAGSAGAPAVAGSAITAGSCVAPATSGATRSGLDERARWAHGLLDQKLYEAALPALRDIARVDPGYPGINLDESDALLNLKRPEDARDAIDTQIGISECLAKLPSAALDSYCSAEFSASSIGGCRPQLSHIRQAAQLQAALVHLELGHRIAPDGMSDPSMADLTRSTPSAADTPVVEKRRPTIAAAPQPVRVRRTVPLPPASEGDVGRPVAAPRAVAQAKSESARPAAAKPGRKANGEDPSLMRGDGTDSAFGAYSKPQ